MWTTEHASDSDTCVTRSLDLPPPPPQHVPHFRGARDLGMYMEKERKKEGRDEGREEGREEVRKVRVLMYLQVHNTHTPALYHEHSIEGNTYLVWEKPPFVRLPQRPNTAFTTFACDAAQRRNGVPACRRPMQRRVTVPVFTLRRTLRKSRHCGWEIQCVRVCECVCQCVCQCVCECF